MVDWGHEGLLDGLDGEARAARERLLTLLAAEGVGLEELRAAVAEDRLVLLPAELALGGTARYTPEEVAALSGLDGELLRALRRAQGLPAVDPDVRANTDADLAAARSARAFRDAGVSPEAMLAVTRVLGRTLGPAAQTMRAVTVDLALGLGDDEYEVARAFGEAAERLAPLAESMVGQLLNLHLRHVARAELLSAAEREAGRLPGARDATIAFADLVGFTRLGESVPVGALGEVAQRLEELTLEHVEPPVRLVKTIGDAVMLVCPASPPLLRGVLALVAAADAEGPDFPQLRAGVARGPTLARAGDWYGRPVNLASRVCGLARPGTVLVTGAVQADGAGVAAFSPTGRKRLKGIAAPVALFRARAPADAPSA